MPGLVPGIHVFTAGSVFTNVIPGRAKSANPESRNSVVPNVWIPGPALRAVPE
jgi:hypothetical protein